MKKRMFVVGGSFLAIAILIVASIPVYANTQTKTSMKKNTESNISINFKNLLERQKSSLSKDIPPLGAILDELINLIIAIIALILIGHPL